MNESATPPSRSTSDAAASILRGLADILESLIVSVILFLLIDIVTDRAKVNGTSMEPNLHNGQYVLVNRLSYKLGSQPQHGDVVVFNFPRDPQQEYVKRIIGLPGDEVLIENSQVSVNGQRLYEPYIAAAPAYTVTAQTVPANHYFVLGDNRNLSYDSHNWGVVPMEYLVGKALLVYWPLDDFRWIEHFYPLAQAPP